MTKEIKKEKVTAKLLKDNPELKAQGAKIGDEVEISDEEETVDENPESDEESDADTEDSVEESIAAKKLNKQTLFTVTYINPNVGQTERVFSVDLHGKDAGKLAQLFADKHNGAVA